MDGFPHICLEAMTIKIIPLPDIPLFIINLNFPPFFVPMLLHVGMYYSWYKHQSALKRKKKIVQ